MPWGDDEELLDEEALLNEHTEIHQLQEHHNEEPQPTLQVQVEQPQQTQLSLQTEEQHQQLQQPTQTLQLQENQKQHPQPMLQMQQQQQQHQDRSQQVRPMQQPRQHNDTRTAQQLVDMIFEKELNSNFKLQFEGELATLNKQLAQITLTTNGQFMLSEHILQTIGEHLKLEKFNMQPTCMGRLDSIVDPKNRFTASTWNNDEITTTKLEIQTLITNFLKLRFNTRQDFINNIKSLMIQTNIVSTNTKLRVTNKSVTFRTDTIDLNTIFFYIQLRASELTRNASLHINSIKKHIPPTLGIHHIHILNNTSLELLKRLTFLYNLNKGIYYN